MSEYDWGRCGWITKAIVSGDIHFMFAMSVCVCVVFLLSLYYSFTFMPSLSQYTFFLFHISKDSICKLLYFKSFLLWSVVFFVTLSRSCLCAVLFFCWINPQGFPPCSTCIKKWSIEMQVQIYYRECENENDNDNDDWTKRRFNIRHRLHAILYGITFL